MATSPLSLRLKRAGSALLGIFRPGSESRAFGVLTGTYGAGGLSPSRTAAEYLQAYSTMPWLRAVAGKVSQAVSVVPWEAGYRTAEVTDERGYRRKAIVDRVLAQGGWALRDTRRKELGTDFEELESHPLLTLLDTGNPFLMGSAVRQITCLHLDILGEAFWLLERNGAGMPVSLWPIPPTWVQQTPDLKTRAYTVQVGMWTGQIPETEVVWFRHPDPASPYGRGTGIVQALGDELEIDEYAAKMLKTRFYSGARADVTISPKLREGEDPISPEEVKRLKEGWLQDHEGFAKASRPYFSSLPIEVNVVSQTFAELQMLELRRQERDTILQVYGGLPPEWMGIIENSNRATIDSAEYLAMKQVVVPRLEFQRSVLQQQLVPQFDPRLVLDYENPVAEDRAYHLEVMKAMPEVPTIDEWRAQAGLPDLDDDTGDNHILRLGIEIKPTLEESEEPDYAGEAVIGGGRVPAPNPPGGDVPSPSQLGVR